MNPNKNNVRGVRGHENYDIDEKYESNIKTDRNSKVDASGTQLRMRVAHPNSK